MNFIRQAFSSRRGWILEEEDLHALTEYFKDLIKITIVGNCQVGKTALMLQLCSGECPEEYIPTVGMNFRTKFICIPGEVPRVIKLQVWDSSGHERYAEIVESYVRGHHIILVFDVTNKESFNSIRSYWHHVAAAGSYGGTKMVLIGNKCDCVDARVVSTTECKNLARELGVDVYIETSARDGTRIDDAFAHLVQQVLG